MSKSICTLHYPTPALPLVRGGSQSIFFPPYQGGIEGGNAGWLEKIQLVHKTPPVHQEFTIDVLAFGAVPRCPLIFRLGQFATQSQRWFCS
jgi:hypothetical protein